MKFRTFNNKVFKHISNLPGWRTNRKIVVIESDDWGSIRMPSLGSYDRLKKAGLNLVGRDALRYNLYDSLATKGDLEDLFQILSNFKNNSENHPVFTALSVVANPDFKKIRESDFTEYFYEPFTETLKRYPGCEQSFELWKYGIEKKLFIPQMHGREHLNIRSWMKSLIRNDIQTRLAFEENMWCFIPDQKVMPHTYFQRALFLNEPIEIEEHRRIIKTGLDLFGDLFNYKASYFVPPNGHISNLLNETLHENGVKFRSTSKIQHESLGNGETRLVFHYLGQKDKTGIRYIIRNCFFEPSRSGIDWVDSCLNDIKISFRLHKPAVVSSHRVNYIGALNSANKFKSLSQLSNLLTIILHTWPDVEFLTSPELGSLMEPQDD